MTFCEKQYNCIKNYFDVTIAAGGIVHFKDEILLIKRRGVWDLPKGKKDKNESLEECAIREITEECGIRNPIIEKKLITTTYIYKVSTKGKKKSKPVLKIVYWYILKLDKKQRTLPQINEDIDQVCWVNLNLARKRLENSYSTIKQVLDEYVNILAN